MKTGGILTLVFLNISSMYIAAVWMHQIGLRLLSTWFFR